MTPIQMLRDSYAFYKAHWKVLTLIVITPSILISLGNLLNITKNGFLVILGTVITIVGVVYTIAMQPSALDAIRKLESDPNAKPGFSTQYKVGFGLFWSILFLMLIETLILLGSTTLFVIPGIIVSLFTSFYMFSLVLDGKKGFAALLESYTLVKGRWWVVLGRLMILAFIGLLSSLILSGVEYILRVSLGLDLKSIPYMVIASLLNLVLYCFIGPFFIIYMYKLYNWMKSTRTAGVPVIVFKRWLTAFLVIGVVAMILMPIFIIGALSQVR